MQKYRIKIINTEAGTLYYPQVKDWLGFYDTLPSALWDRSLNTEKRALQHIEADKKARLWSKVKGISYIYE